MYQCLFIILKESNILKLGLHCKIDFVLRFNMDMTYAICDSQLEVHYFAHLVMAPDVYVVPCDMCGILGPMVMQFRNLRGVRLLGSMVILSDDMSNEGPILNQGFSICFVCWSLGCQFKVFFFKLAAILFLVTSHVIYFVTDSHPLCLCHLSIYVVRYCAESSIDLNPPFKSTVVSFDLENFEKF